MSFRTVLNIFKIDLSINHQQFMKTSDGAINPTGGRPVCGSVPFGLLNNKICGYGLCNS